MSVEISPLFILKNSMILTNCGGQMEGRQFILYFGTRVALKKATIEKSLKSKKR